MDEVYLGMGRMESLIMPCATIATHAPENSTAAMLENILARFAGIETRLIEHVRRAAATLPPLRPEPDPPDAATLYTATQLPYQSPWSLYQPTTTFQQQHAAQLPQQYLQQQQPYQPPAPPPDALQWRQPQQPEMQDWRWQQHQPHTQPVQTRRPTSWDLPDYHQQSGFMSYDQYPLPYHHWEKNQPPPSPPWNWDSPAQRSLHSFPPHNLSHVRLPRQQLRRTNLCWDPPQLYTTHSAYDQPLPRHSSPNSCWYPPPHHSADDHPLAQNPPPLQPLPCCEPDQIITSEMVEEKIEAGEYDQESEKNSLSLGQETAPHQTMEKNDSLNGMGSFLDEIGDLKSTILYENRENKATFEADEFIEMEPQFVKLRDVLDLNLDFDLCVGDVTGIVYRSTSLDADARFIPPRIDLLCLSVLGYTGELFVLVWNFSDYIGSPLMIFYGGDERRKSLVLCPFDPGGMPRQSFCFQLSQLLRDSHLEDKVDFNRGGVDTFIIP